MTVGGGCQWVLKDSPLTTSSVVSSVCPVACVASLATCSAVAVISAIDGVSEPGQDLVLSHWAYRKWSDVKIVSSKRIISTT